MTETETEPTTFTKSETEAETQTPLIDHPAAARRFALRKAYERHFENPRRERAFLHAVGFTCGFAGCRVVTHAIRSGRGPFHNLSAGGRHLHHSTPGIIGQITLGYLWTWQLAVGTDPQRRAASRAATLAAGLATALTLDEFALWFDLADDYWDSAGRKSIDVVVLFWGLSAMVLTGRGLAREMGVALRDLERLRASVLRGRAAGAGSHGAAGAGPFGPGPQPVAAGTSGLS